MSSENTVEKLFGPQALSEPAKPGSRRARREAERHATAEIPAVKDVNVEETSHDTASAADAVPASSGETAASYGLPPIIGAGESAEAPAGVDVADDHVSQPEKPARRFHFFKAASIAVVAAAAVGSSLGLVAISDRGDRATAAEVVQGGAGNNLMASVAAQPTPHVENIGLSGERGEETQSFTAIINGEKRTIGATETDTYGSALEAAGIVIGSYDEVSVSLGERVEPGSTITIVGVKQVTETEEYTEEYETKKVEDDSLEKGTTKVKTKGKNGTGVRTYEVRYEDGEEVSRELTMETVSQKRVDEVVLVGTAEPEPVVAAPAPTTSSSSSSSASSSSSSTSSSSPTKQKSTSSQSTTQTQSAPAPAPVVSASGARGIAQGMLASFGWGMDQWPYLDRLWQRESGWNHTAMNPSSGAYGIPQSLPGSKMATAGADWRTNPATQIRWGLGYIKGRYGSPQNAWAHSQAVGWY